MAAELSRRPVSTEWPFSAVIRFTDVSEPWASDVAWSLLIEKDSARSGEYDCAVYVNFRVGQAPTSELRAGRAFELYEGGKCVAIGVLYDDSDC